MFATYFYKNIINVIVLLASGRWAFIESFPKVRYHSEHSREYRDGGDLSLDYEDTLDLEETDRHR